MHAVSRDVSVCVCICVLSQIVVRCSTYTPYTMSHAKGEGQCVSSPSPPPPLSSPNKLSVGDSWLEGAVSFVRATPIYVQPHVWHPNVCFAKWTEELVDGTDQ